MLVTTIDEARKSRGHGIRLPFYLRHWTCVAGLAFADATSFALAALLFRVWRPEPKIFVGDVVVAASHGTPIDLFTVLALLFIGLRAFAGDYSRRGPFWDSLRGTFVALFVTSLPDLVAVGMYPQRYSVTASIASWIFLFAAVPVLRQGVRIFLKRLGLWQRRTALIGAGAAAEVAYQTLHNSLSMGLDVQWFVSIEPAAEIPERLSGLKRILTGKVSEVGRLVQAAGCDQAIVALDEERQNIAPDVVQRLNEANVQTAIIPAMGRLPMGNFTTNVLFGRNILLFQTRDNLKRWPQRTFKRAFDVLGAFAGLIVLSPVFLVLAILIKRRDGGSVFYSQVRIGRDGQPFYCIKFRTMTVDADERLANWRIENPKLYEEYQRTFKLHHDPRVTAFGNFLRKTSLDELPQLVNILRGEMSFVGPRPVIERELVEHYGPAAQLYMRVRPGLTGLWQISGRSDTTYPERIAFDEWYILNWSFWYDVIIIAQTFRAVASGYGAR